MFIFQNLQFLKRGSSSVDPQAWILKRGSSTVDPQAWILKSVSYNIIIMENMFL